MKGISIETDENNDFTCDLIQKFQIMIADEMDKEAIKVIKKYCDENNIFPYIIDENKLKVILKLGFEEYNKRESEME